MGNIVFNIAKGRHARYADLPATNDALVLVLLKAAGLESDATLQDYDTLAAILAAANDECDFTNYTRKNLATVSVTVDDSGNLVKVDADDPSAYTNGGSVQAAGAALVCYDEDTTGGNDSNLIPLYKFDAAVTFDPGVATTVAISANGLATST